LLEGWIHLQIEKNIDWEIVDAAENLCGTTTGSVAFSRCR